MIALLVVLATYRDGVSKWISLQFSYFFVSLPFNECTEAFLRLQHFISSQWVLHFSW